MNCLIVDDSRIMRNIIKNSIVNEGLKEFTFLEASDGKEALGIIESKDIAVVLLDWNMPNLNGLQLVKKLRNDARFVSLPIIMITSEAAKYNVIEAVKEGVNDYLLKPVSERTLAEKLRSIVLKKK
ncbi:MAG: response regulator [Spirochaetales bacterium]|nr:response regulator [Spirochaetales bacterium]